jgi:hypothetical protein
MGQLLAGQVQANHDTFYPKYLHLANLLFSAFLLLASRFKKISSRARFGKAEKNIAYAH